MKKIGFPPYYQTEESVAALKVIEDYSEHSLDVQGYKMHIVQSGSKDAPVILFIHGSPGKWTAWADYLLDETLRSKAHMLAVDRVGFGRSDMGRHEPDLKKQVQVIMGAIEQLIPHQKLIIIGHSYGGPVALRIAVDYPEQVQSLILLAPSIDPKLEENRWFNTLAGFSFIRPILPKAVDHSNQEILQLQPELEDMTPLLKNSRLKVSIIHGEKDSLVPVGNTHYGKRKLVSADVEMHLLPNRGHFIPWEEHAFVKAILLDHLTSAN